MLNNPFENRPITRTAVHIVYRLYGSLPWEIVDRIRQQMEKEITTLRLSMHLSTTADLTNDFLFLSAVTEIKEKYLRKYDQMLDQIKEGPMFLSDPAAKKIVIDSWLFLEQKEDLEIYAISVMSNHVHVLLAHASHHVEQDFKQLLFRHKKFTGVKINTLHQQAGRRVWARTTFDRDVRKDTFGTVLWYVLNNPVKAGLTSSPLDWHGNYLRSDLK